MALVHQPAWAQDQSPPPSLEDLIPDSAVENPEAWAEETEVPDEFEAIEPLEPVDGQAELDAIEATAPLADLPELTVDWPDDLDIPELQPLDPDPDIQFAENDLPVEIEPEIGDVEQVDEQIAVAFPTDTALFPNRDEFLEDYISLSTVEELGDSDSLALLAARARADEELLRELLRVYGYYDGTVRRIVGGIAPGEGEADPDAGVRFDILPGERYSYGTIDLGRLATAPDADFLRSVFEIESGDFLNSYEIVEEQADLDLALGETGYAFAEITAPELLIDHADLTGDLTMLVDPKGKYVFGGVTSRNEDFLSGSHLASIARFEPGETYQRSLQLDLRRAITATGLVSSVVITPREVTPPQNGEPGVVEMDVELTEAPLRTLAFALGYGSEEGIRIQGSWEHRNLFPPEGALRVRGILGTKEQLAGVTFRKNNFGGRDRVLTLDAFASTLDSNAFDASTAGVTAQYEKTSTLLFQKPLSWSLGIQGIATRESPPAVAGVEPPRETYFIAALPASALIDASDNLLDPTEGFRLGGRVSPELSINNGEQSFYVKTQIDASYYQSVSDGVIAAGRVRFGTIPGTDLENIAPSRRFYAGGGGSVRGYGFQRIGPVDTLGEPSGGRSVVEVAAEARIRTGFLDGAVSVVPFVDAGSVSDAIFPDLETVRIGAGVGVRYATGFGPLRLDVGVPLNPGPDDAPVGVYVSLGQAF
ncbi:BamA/TamA family outer membrane protein [Qipengyuania sp. JC766]|uniref:autotransporter assembly complex protein TamA n=1 Tax=Qipengyuania sp. JC766 TaxID=3232139 RepID=UPI00345A5124